MSPKNWVLFSILACHSISGFAEDKLSCAYQAKLAQKSDEILFGISAENYAQRNYLAHSHYTKPEVSFSPVVFRTQPLRTIGSCTLSVQITGMGTGCFLGSFPHCDDYYLTPSGFYLRNNDVDLANISGNAEETFETTVKKGFSSLRTALKNCECS